MPNNTHNGHQSQPPKNSAKSRSAGASGRESPASGSLPQARGFSLADTRRCGFQLSMLMPAIVLGLGTTSSKIVNRLMSLLIEEVGGQPKSCDYLLIDGAAAQPGMDVSHHKMLGIDGCGTLPSEGRRAFRRHWDELLYTLTQMALGLSPTDVRVPASTTVRQSLDVRIVSGCGGSSGGMLHEAMTLAWQMSRRLNISELRINLLLIGAEMPLNDTSRSIVREQQLVVSDTAANNFTKACGDFSNANLLSEVPVGDAPFSIPACQRAASIDLIDQSNGQHDFAVTDQLVEMAAQGLMAKIFTPAGQSIEERARDPDWLGTFGRGQWRC